MYLKFPSCGYIEKNFTEVGVYRKLSFLFLTSEISVMFLRSSNEMCEKKTRKKRSLFKCPAEEFRRNVEVKSTEPLRAHLVLVLSSWFAL